MTPETAPAGHRLRLVLLLLVPLVLLVVLRSFVVQTFYVPDDSMAPTLTAGERVVVTKWATGDLARGDVVVVDRSDLLPPASSEDTTRPGMVGRVLGSLASLLSVDTGESDQIQRVIGVPGDHVVCCDKDGAMTVDDQAVREGYVFAAAPSGTPAAPQRLDVRVPDGQVLVLSDDRSTAGRADASLVPVSHVVGRVSAVFWPPASAGAVAGATR